MPTYQFFAYDPAVLPFDSGSNSFTFASDYDFTTDRVSIEVTDDDTFFDGDFGNDEIGEDANQTGSATFDNGTLVSGLIYVEEYAMLQAPDGTIIYVDRIEIGGQLVGYSPSQPMVPGVTYAYTGGDNVDDDVSGADTRMEYAAYQAQSVPCFATGTRIDTDRGAVPVQWLRSGDLVQTFDDGFQPIVWAGRCPADGKTAYQFLPDPRSKSPTNRPLRLSAAHRVLLENSACELLFAQRQVLASARALRACCHVRPTKLGPQDSFHHLLLPRHALIRAEGYWVESLFLGDMGLTGPWMRIGATMREDMQDGYLQTVRPCLRSYEVRVWTAFTQADLKRRKMRVA